MTRNSSRLGSRLKKHFAAIRSQRAASCAAHWQVYAAAAGSALALATNASASIIYSGVQNLTASVDPAITTSFASNAAHLLDSNGQQLPQGFNLVAANFIANTQHGLNRQTEANLLNASGLGGLKFFTEGGVPALFQRYGAGSLISGRKPAHPGAFLLNTGTPPDPGFTAGATGFGGFRFFTANGQEDFGWIRLTFELGSVFRAQSIEAIDWAYDSTGAPIVAGDEGPPPTLPTPEPATGGIALLASGAAGVVALRRRKRAS